MQLHLTFANGVISGDGNDDIGRFLIKGRYDSQTAESHWTKTYVGAHDVFYRGFREGKGIWGTWEIAIHNHGGFHIWPRGAGEGESDSQTAEQVQPMDAIGPSVNAPVEGKTLPHVPQNYGVRRQARRDAAFDGLRSSEIAVKEASRFACPRTP